MFLIRKRNTWFSCCHILWHLKSLIRTCMNMFMTVVIYFLINLFRYFEVRWSSYHRHQICEVVSMSSCEEHFHHCIDEPRSSIHISPTEITCKSSSKIFFKGDLKNKSSRKKQLEQFTIKSVDCMTKVYAMDNLLDLLYRFFQICVLICWTLHEVPLVYVPSTVAKAKCISTFCSPFSAKTCSRSSGGASLLTNDLLDGPLWLEIS